MSEKFYPKSEQAQQLIKFLYKETSQEERASLLPGIFDDSECRETFDDLLDTKTQLDKLSVEDWLSIASIPAPSKSCTDKIMQAAIEANL